jgi:predicted DNA-binding transcriptional regulator AlpA
MALGKLYTTEELAALLRISPRTLEDWELDGKAPKSKRLGGPRGPLRYREADVEAWLEASPAIPANA